jgi:hypothetical protein
MMMSTLEFIQSIFSEYDFVPISLATIYIYDKNNIYIEFVECKSDNLVIEEPFPAKFYTK